MEFNGDTAVCDGVRRSGRPKKPSRRMQEDDDDSEMNRKKISHRLLENDYWYESSRSPKKRARQSNNIRERASSSRKRPRSPKRSSTAEHPVSDLHQDAVLALAELSKPKLANCGEEANGSKHAAVTTTTTSSGHGASRNVTSHTNDAPMEAIVEEMPSSIHWKPSSRQGSVVLSTLDGKPLVLLEGVGTDVSELFRTGKIQATSLVGTQQAKQSTATVKNEPSIQTPTQLFPAGRKYSRWTDEEDDVLRKAAQGVRPIEWKRISRVYFRGMRTADQCKNRWKKCLMPGLRRAPWTEEEDTTIMDGVKAGLKWSEIAKKLDGRISEQVRDHWMNQLDPTLKKDPWTEEEIEILFRCQAQMGNKWTEIAKRLPGRSENAVKNRWHNAKVSRQRKLKRLSKESQVAEILQMARAG